MPRRQGEVEDDEISNISDDEYGKQARADEEDRFKYSTADIGESKRNTTCCLVAMCLVCLALAITLSIVLGNLGKDDGEGADATSPTMAPDSGNSNRPPGQGKFLKTLAFVQDTCSSDNFEVERDGCEEVCVDFDCCDPFAAEDVSCFHGNRQGCINHARCHVLSNRVPPPGDNLADVCDPAQVAEDPTDCEDRCTNTKCCYEPDSSCKVSDFWACVDFAPCQHLRGSDLQVPMPFELIDGVCKGTAAPGIGEKYPTCEEICAPAACCFSTGSDSCLEDNFFTCLHYTPCKKLGSPLKLPEAGETVPLPNATMTFACSPRGIMGNGPESCEQACVTGSCCADGGTTETNGTTSTCFNSDPLGCLMYDSCKLV